MIRRLEAKAAAAMFGAALACSATVPDTQYPPPPPADGLPYIPFPEESELADDGFGDSPTAEPQSAEGSGPSSIDPALPEAPSLVLDRKASCGEPKCELKSWLPDAGYAKSVSGGEPSSVALWAQELTAGSSLVLPRHHGFDVMSVVLSGSVLALGDDGGGGRKLGVWHALRAPGAGLSLKADAEGAKLLLAIVSGKGTIDDALERAKTKPWEVRWTKRPSAIASSSLIDAKNLTWAGGAFHARIAFGGEYQVPASLGTLLASKDAAVAEHDHPSSEHIVIVEGSGTFQLGATKHKVVPGSVFQIKDGVKHSFIPSGKSRLVAIQLYAPSGPEQRFAKLSAESKQSAPDKQKQPTKQPEPPAGAK